MATLPSMMVEIALRRAEIEYEMCGYLAKYDDGDSIEESREEGAGHQTLDGGHLGAVVHADDHSVHHHTCQAHKHQHDLWSNNGTSLVKWRFD